MKITAIVNGTPESLIALTLNEDTVGNWVICCPETDPTKRLFIPVTDIIETRKTYFGFEGTIEFVLPEGITLNVGDFAKATFFWPGRSKVSSHFSDIDHCEDFVDHIINQGTAERYFLNMREFEKEYRLIKLEVRQPDMTFITVYDDSAPPLVL